MKKMNPEVKHLWLNALRSGDYEQGREKLRNDKDQYCCLGVLCEIYRKKVSGVDLWCADESDHKYTIFGQPAYISASVKEWAGLDSIDPKVEAETESHYPAVEIELTSLNDDFKWDFSQIADAIEKSL